MAHNVKLKSIGQVFCCCFFLIKNQGGGGGGGGGVRGICSFFCINKSAFLMEEVGKSGDWLESEQFWAMGHWLLCRLELTDNKKTIKGS